MITVETLAGGGVVEQVSTYADLDEGQWGLMIDPRGWLSVIRGNPGKGGRRARRHERRHSLAQTRRGVAAPRTK
jgi:hypothetical protein